MENIILTNNKDLRLVSVKVGVLSTLRFELPLVSASATHVEVIVTSGNVHSAYTATFIADTKFWQCDIAASQFPAVGRQSYEVAYVLDGKQFWDGKGWIEIEDATTSGIEPQPRPEPYRYAVVSVNGYGADAQGAVRIPKTVIATDSPATTEGYMEGDIYFNRETGATWTLCNVQGTLTWVFNYKNYYTKAETEEAIDRVAAYYITSDAQGNPFATHAALVNATTYYSGGSVRVPTRNDYAIVIADETHNNEEWRYIYSENAQGVGQWEPQYAVEGVIAYDNTVTRMSANGVKSSGIWSAIWGALAALPTGFTSLYDWCVAQLAGKLDTSSAAPAFTAKIYAVNDLCTYNGVIYRCKVGYTATASSTKPDADTTHWEAKPVSDLFLRAAHLVTEVIPESRQFADVPGVVVFNPNGVSYLSQLSEPELMMLLQNGGVVDAFGNAMCFPTRSATSNKIYDFALAVDNPTAGNLAALDSNGNPTDSTIPAADVAVKGEIPYILVTKTISNNAVTLDDRASSAVTISTTLSPNTLTINFPTATSGKVRDFAMRLNIAAGVTAPEIAWPQGVTLENDGGEVPEIADGGTGGSSTILYFSETENNGTTAKFLVKGETLTAIAQA